MAALLRLRDAGVHGRRAVLLPRVLAPRVDEHGARLPRDLAGPEQGVMPEQHENPCRWLKGGECECTTRRRLRAEARASTCARCGKKHMGAPGEDLCWCPDD